MRRTLGLSLILLTVLSTAAMAAGSFRDTAGSYARQEIDFLSEQGILSGYEDGSFRPNDPITRAELAKALAMAAGAKEDPAAAAGFADIRPDDWFAGYAGALVKAGIVSGTSDTTFSPAAHVTREELAVLIVRALGIEGKAQGDLSDVPFKDKDAVSSWAEGYVALAYRIGLIQGSEQPEGGIAFNPRAKADRQALARLIYSLLKHKEEYIAAANAGGTGGNPPGSGTGEPADRTPPEVMSATAIVGGGAYTAVKTGTNQFSFDLSQIADEKAKLTSFAISASPDARKLTVSHLGETKEIAFSNGKVSANVSQLLGSLDPQGDGVSIAKLRSVLRSSGTISGTLSDNSGNQTEVVLVLKVN